GPKTSSGTGPKDIQWDRSQGHPAGPFPASPVWASSPECRSSFPAGPRGDLLRGGSWGGGLGKGCLLCCTSPWLLVEYGSPCGTLSHRALLHHGATSPWGEAFLRGEALAGRGPSGAGPSRGGAVVG